jgi:hypothetical protein
MSNEGAPTHQDRDARTGAVGAAVAAERLQRGALRVPDDGRERRQKEASQPAVEKERKWRFDESSVDAAGVEGR